LQKLVYIIPVIVILVYFFFLSFMGEWFVYNSLFHNIVIEHLVTLSENGLLTDTSKEWYRHLLFIIERVFDLVIFLPFCFLLYKLKISRKSLIGLVLLGFIVFHSFVYWDFESLNLYGYLSIMWWLFICCGLLSINQLFGVKNRNITSN